MCAREVKQLNMFFSLPAIYDRLWATKNMVKQTINMYIYIYIYYIIYIAFTVKTMWV